MRKMVLLVGTTIPEWHVNRLLDIRKIIQAGVPGHDVVLVPTMTSAVEIAVNESSE